MPLKTEHKRNEEIAIELSTRIDNANTSINNGQSVENKIDRELDNKVAYEYAQETNTWIDDLYLLGSGFIGGNENTNAVNESEQKIYKSNNLMNTLSLRNFLLKIKLHNFLFTDTHYEFVGFTGLKKIGAGRYYVEPIYKQDFIIDAEFATPEEINNYMTQLGFEQASEFKFKKGTIEVYDLRPRNVLKDKNGDIFIIDAEFKTLNETVMAEIVHYLNPFHKESTKRKIKAIQEMKKKSMNYEH